MCRPYAHIVSTRSSRCPYVWGSESRFQAFCLEGNQPLAFRAVQGHSVSFEAEPTLMEVERRVHPHESSSSEALVWREVL